MGIGAGVGEGDCVGVGEGEGVGRGGGMATVDASFVAAIFVFFGWVDSKNIAAESIANTIRMAIGAKPF